MKPPLTVAAATDVGCVRQSNEDFFRHAAIGDDYWAVVADGCGGEAAGEVASHLAVETFGSHLEENRRSTRDLAFIIRDAVVASNSCILAEAISPEKQGMATTFSGIYLRDRRVILFHTGDSRVYRDRAGKFELLTEDHTWVMGEVKAGRMTPEAAANHPRSGWLIRALGQPDFTAPDMDFFESAKGDLYLLTSDGLLRCLEPPEIEKIIRESPPEEAVKRLVQAARARQAPDNVTVIILRVDG